MNRLLALLPLALVLAGGAGIAKRTLTPLPMPVARVRHGTAVATVFATGYVEARLRGVLRVTRAAEVSQILKHESERVRRGEAVVRLYNAGLQSRRERIQAELDFTTANLAPKSAFRLSALAMIRQVAEEEEYAKAELERRRASMGTVFQAREVDEFASRARALAERHRALEYQHDHDILELELRRRRATADLATIAAEEDDDTLESPLDGVVLTVLPKLGETVLPGEELVKIGDMRDLIVEADVDEDDIHRVVVGQRAIMRLAGNEDTALSGEVYEVLPDATRRTKTYVVRLRLLGSEFSPAPDDPTGLLGRVRVGGLEVRSGMSVELGIIVEELANALLLPTSAVTTRGTVFIPDPDGALTERQVAIGIRNFEVAQVTSGIDLGEPVVVEGVAKLRAGMRIQATEPGGPPR